MNPIAWLLARLRRPQPTPNVPDAAPVPMVPATAQPKVPPAPPTEADRLARAPQRAQWVEQLLLAEETKAVAEGRPANDLPADIRRLIIIRGFNQADLEIARENGWWEEGLRLQMEAQELEATIKFEGWQYGLCKDHGEEIGRKLARHQVEPGMTLQHMVAAFGVPAEKDIIPHPTELGIMYVSYGSLEVGSHFELRNDIITRVQLGTAAFPDYVYNGRSVME